MLSFQFSMVKIMIIGVSKWRLCLILKMPVFDDVKNKFEEPADTQKLNEEQMKDLKQKRSRNAAVLSMIRRGVTPSIIPKIMRLKKAKEAWEVLKQEFQGDIKVRGIKLQTLRRDYENTKMKENESLNDYSSRLTDLINQMKSYGDEIEDQRIVEKILISILKKFDPIIAVIENTKELKTLGIHDLLSSLKSYEQRMTRHSGKAIESAFQSSLQGEKRP
ncbi:hypothetical protein Tco_0813280 [Tanacetum coccineum]